MCAMNASKVESTGGTYTPIPVGTYMARVARVIDFGVQPQEYKGEAKPPKQEINLTYELPTLLLNDDPSKPRWISESFPLNSIRSDKARSTLRLKTLDPKNDTGGDFTKLLGAPCLITVALVERNGKSYNNIAAVAMPMVGVTTPALVNKAVVFDLDGTDRDLFDTLPQWMKEKIMGGIGFDQTPFGCALLGNTPMQANQPAFPSESEGMDDVPFNQVD